MQDPFAIYCISVWGATNLSRVRIPNSELIRCVTLFAPVVNFYCNRILASSNFVPSDKTDMYFGLLNLFDNLNIGCDFHFLKRSIFFSRKVLNHGFVKTSF